MCVQQAKRFFVWKSTEFYGKIKNKKYVNNRRYGCMKIDEIKTIVQMMSEHDLSEFKIEAEDMHLCIRRGTTGPTHVTMPAPTYPAPAPVPVAPVATSVESAKPEVRGETINSPIVGTFYRAPAPDAEPFVQIGSKVTPETVICIVEAMKVMNEIKAETTGTIKEVLVENAQAVEYGQPLFVLE